MEINLSINRLEKYNYHGKTVLLRVDINSPVDPVSKMIVSENRIDMSLSTIKYLMEQKAKIVLIAHQGDTLDYQNLIPLVEHAKKLSQKTGVEVKYIDDVAGPAAQNMIKNLKAGEILLLGNLRYLTEEVSTFEDAVKLKPSEMLNTYLVRNLSPLVDYYVNDAFAAAHRNAPSMVAFQEIKPTAGGRLLIEELVALTRVRDNPERPAVFLLGGAKISDAFSMMKQVLENGAADRILACGVTGHVMLTADGYDIGDPNMMYLRDRSLEVFIKPAKDYLKHYREKIVYPVDLAFEEDGIRKEIEVENLPINTPTFDVGTKTIDIFVKEILNAGTVFMNGPVGVYEKEIFEIGTKAIFNALVKSKGYTLIGGGDTVSAAQRYIDLNKLNYVSTAGGAMIRYLSGIKLPLIEAMEKAYENKMKGSN